MALHLVTADISREQKLKVAYAAWARGDVNALLTMFADDCEFTLVGNPALNPHAGLRIGIPGLREVFEHFHRMFEVREFLLEKVIVKDDDAIVHWHSTLLFRPNEPGHRQRALRPHPVSRRPHPRASLLL